MRRIIWVLIVATLLAMSTTTAFARSRGNMAVAKWLNHSLRAVRNSERPIASPRGWLEARANAGAGIKSELPNWIREPQQITLKHEYYRPRDDFREQRIFRYVGADGAPLAVPEPGSIVSLAAPLLGTIVYWRRRRS